MVRLNEILFYKLIVIFRVADAVNATDNSSFTQTITVSFVLKVSLILK
jgi:hypothetical protein